MPRAKKSPPDIVHEHPKMEAYSIRAERNNTLQLMCMPWTDRQDGSLNLRFSTFPKTSNPFWSSECLYSPCDNGLWLQGTHGRLWTKLSQSWVTESILLLAQTVKTSLFWYEGVASAVRTWADCGRESTLLNVCFQPFLTPGSSDSVVFSWPHPDIEVGSSGITQGHMMI